MRGSGLQGLLRLAGCLLAMVAAGEPVLGLSLQAPPAERTEDASADTLARWFVAVQYDRELISSDLPAWTDWTRRRAVVYRDLAGGTIGAEFAHVERFGRGDVGFALDGYRNLWERAYANLRLGVTPAATVLADVDARFEIFQAFADGWEVSGSYRRMDFTATDVDVAGVGLARYLRDWYLRSVAAVSTVAGRSTWSLSGLARRFLTPPREFLEISGSLGREAVIVGAGPTVELRRTRLMQARIQRFLRPSWGVAAAVSYIRFEGTPTRRAFSIGLITRF